MKLKQSFATVIFFEIIVIIVLSIGILGYLWINKEYKTFSLESERLKLEYIENQKSIIRNEVNHQVEYIQYMKSQTYRILMSDIRDRTYEAYGIAMNIYNENKGSKNDDEIRKMITDALRPVRFNEGRGYYFIDSLDGDVILYPVLPESEGSNLINLQDGKGNYALQDEIKLVRERGEGFITGYWIKPDIKDSKTYEKVTFVKRFEPYNWYMGNGEYVDDVVSDIQNEVLYRIRGLDFGYKNNMYMSVGTYDGLQLVSGEQSDYAGKVLWDMTDAKGNKVIQEQIAAAKKYPEGGFLAQYWKKPDSGKVSERLTFVMAVPEWKWVVSAGIEMDEIEKVISGNRIELQKVVQREIRNIIMLLIAVLLVAFILTKYLTDKNRTNLEVFLAFLRNASKKYAEVDVGKLHYSEFEDLAAAANAMISERNTVEEKIRTLNDELEDRILERTREIEELNASLERKVEERTLELNRMLIVDGLTQVYNHKYMYERLEKEVGKASENKEKFCIVMLDIDHFKDVNDSFGHQCGDTVLTKVAGTIRDNIRPEDVAGRYGGEEFIIIMPETGMEKGYEIAEMLRDKIMSMRFREKGLSITISGGIVEYTSENAVEMVRKADEKLYEAKKLGRNRIQR